MRRWWMALLLVLLVLAGCTEAPESKVMAPTEELTTIKLGVVQSSYDTAIDALIAHFQAKTAGYRVVKVPLDPTPQGREKVLEMMHRGEVDIVSDLWFDESRRAAIYRPLDGFLAQGGLDQTQFGGLLDELKADGRVVEVPYVVVPFVLLYNAEMAAAAGVAVPRDHWTWDEFRAALRQLTRRQGAEKVWGLDTPDQEGLAHIWLAEKSDRPIWETTPAELREVLSFFHTLSFTDQSMPPAPKAQIDANGIRFSHSGPSPHALISGGKAAMAYGPTQDPPALRQMMKVAWDVAPMPAPPGARPVIQVMTRSMGIPYNASQEQADAAWKFISFAAGPEGAVILARTGNIPVLRNEAVLQAWAEQNPPAPSGYASVFQADWRTQLPALPGRSSTHSVGHRHMEAMKAMNWALSGVKTVDDAVAGYAAAYDQK